jgi:hypothetical protein
MVRTQVQLTARQAQLVKELAAEHGVSIAEVIRQALDAMVQSSPRVTRDEIRRRALAAVGAVRDGPTDMSENHDDYAVEAFEQ